jgi:DNA-binding NarL/FixJ family response regulator
MQPMLREILKEILHAQPDMQVVGEFSESVPLLSAVERSEAAFAIASSDRANFHERCRELLRERPGVKVLAIAGDGRQSYLCELDVSRRPLGTVSPQQLVAVIRSIAPSTLADRPGGPS